MFVNTRLLSPVVYNGATTAPKDSFEYNRWWDEEKDRCLNGFSQGGTAITGAHYFYLNHWTIRAVSGQKGARRGLMSPRFTDIDHEYFWEIQKAREAKQDLLIFKRRQTGHSYKSGCILAHEGLFFPDSYSIVTAGEDKYAEKTFKDCKTGLSQLGRANSEFYKNTITNNSDEVLFGYEEEINGVKHRGGFLSTIRSIVAKDPQALVGTSPSFVYYEEIGMFPKLIDTKGYTDPAMEVNGVKEGFSLLVGTGGEANKSIDEVTTMFYDPGTYNLRAYDNTYDEDFVSVDDAKPRDLRKICLFVPGYKFLKIDDDGNSLIEESKQLLIERRKTKEKDKKAWLKEVTQFPMTPDEGLMVPDGNQFNAQKLRAQLGQIMRYQQNMDRMRLGDIEWIRDDLGRITGAEWIDFDPNNPLSTGRFRMTEAPYIDPVTKKTPEGLYLGGTDSYDKDKTASVHGSFGSMYMMKTFVNTEQDADMIVCGLTERPPTAEEFFEDTAKMCVLYGWARNLIEHSNLLIGEWYLRNGFARLLKERPEVAYATTIESKSQNNWGVETTTKPYWLIAAADYIEKNVHKMWDPELIKALLKYQNDPKYNCDRTISFSLAVVHLRDMIHLRSKPKDDGEVTPFSLRYVKEGNRIIRL